MAWEIREIIAWSALQAEDREAEREREAAKDEARRLMDRGTNR